MTKNELRQKTDAVCNATKDALQSVYDALNNGQKKKLLKETDIATLFERYGVSVEAEDE